MKYTKKEWIVIIAVSPLIALNLVCVILSRFFEDMAKGVDDFEVVIGRELVKLLKIKNP
jgi:hypothetical protein